MSHILKYRDAVLRVHVPGGPTIEFKPLNLREDRDPIPEEDLEPIAAKGTFEVEVPVVQPRR